MQKNILKLILFVVAVISYLYTEYKSPLNTSQPKILQQAHTKGVSTKNVLAISWQNAFCQLHQHKLECKKQNASMASATSFTLHGLWPQPRNKQNCSHQKVDLERDVYRNLTVVMPGVISGLHKHEWKKHGTCYGTSDERYFEDSISLINQVNTSAVQTLFKTHIGKRLSKKQVMQAFDKDFGKGSGRKVKMMCQKGYITELQISLDGHIDASTSLAVLLKNAKPQMGGCNGGKVDRVGF